MRYFSRVTSILGVLGIILAIGSGCSSLPSAEAKKAESGSILDFFPATPGWSLTYDFISQNDPNDSGKRWVTFQNPALDGEFSFHYMEIKTGEDAACIWKTDGEIIGASNSRQNRYNDGAFRYFFLVNMPAQYQNGMDYAVQNTAYHVTTGNTWKDYRDCVNKLRVA
jgi:hypothetical protein